MWHTVAHMETIYERPEDYDLEHEGDDEDIAFTPGCSSGGVHAGSWSSHAGHEPAVDCSWPQIEGRGSVVYARQEPDTAFHALHGEHQLSLADAHLGSRHVGIYAPPR